MDFLKLVKDQRSIRKYTSEQISREEMDMILEAGACAPNAGGSQRNMFVGIRDAQLTHRIGRMNYRPFHRGEVNVSHVSREQPSLIDDGSIKDGFYGAPAVIAIFGEKDFPFSIADAFCAAENMLLTRWKVPVNYICRAFIILGHLAGPLPHRKPIRPGRCLVVE